MIKVKKALISVSDKEGIVEFAKGLRDFNIEIISTGGTFELLKKEGVDVKKVSEVTGFPEILEGRVKTLHPIIFGGILAKRDSHSHQQDLAKTEISPVDMVVVNFYPFESVIKEKNIKLEEALEYIDIGGPSVLRAAAKNYADVIAISSPEYYSEILDEMKNNNGEISLDTSLKLAGNVFSMTSEYDRIISDFFITKKEDEEIFPEKIALNLYKVKDLRYGENPHQKASLYSELQEDSKSGMFGYEQIHGKELSFNNLIDIDSASTIAGDFDLPCTAIIKHTNPCGVGIDENLTMSLKKALECDPMSAFGGVFSFNRKVNEDTAKKLSEMFIEVIIAPEFDKDAFDILSKKKKLILLKKKEGLSEKRSDRLDFKKIRGGFLAQEYDKHKINMEQLNVVTKRKPEESEVKAMVFGWKIIKYVKSNAVIFTSQDRTLGIGAGQMSRVDSCEIAIRKADKSNISLVSSAVSSDAFFPFSDSVELIAKSGATAIIQPGGSIRDKEVIEAADKYNLTMVFTGHRQFRH